MMKNYFKYMVLVMCCLMGSLSASAQFSQTVEQYPATNYDTKVASFPMADVAEALSTDAATLIAALQSWTAEGSTDPDMFFLQGADPADYENYYTQGGKGGFWMDKTPAPVAWVGPLTHAEGVAEPVWYNTISWTEGSDETPAAFNIAVGQYPDTLKAGDEVKATFLLRYNEKEATFAITLSVVEKPVVNIPEAETDPAKLEIVGTQTFKIEAYPNASAAVEIDLKDVAAKLGCDEALFVEKDNLQQLLYTVSGTVTDGFLIRDAALSNTSTANAIGFWYGQLYDANTEVYLSEAASRPWGANAGRTFYMEGFAFNAETQMLTATLGQENGALKTGQDAEYEYPLFATLYLIYGTKAYSIRVELTVVPKPQGAYTLENMEKVGEEKFTIEQYPTNDYSTSRFSLEDYDAVAAALGIETSDIKIMVMSGDGSLTDEGSTNNTDGFWMTNEGVRTTWGNGSALFVDPITSGNYSTLEIGQFPNFFKAEDTAVIHIYLVNQEVTKYYDLEVTLNILKKEEVDPNTLEIVATREVQIATTTVGDYHTDDMWATLPVEDIESLIGTSAPKLMGQAIPEEGATEVVYSDAYSCDPKPGFWLTKDGYVTEWGAAEPATASFGICYVSDNEMGNFEFFTYPGRNAIGDVRTAVLYLLNEANGKIIQVNCTLAFGEGGGSTTIYREVGGENITLPADDNAYTVIDLTKAKEALEFSGSDEDLLSNKVLCGMKEDGSYTQLTDPTAGVSFNTDNYAIEEGSDEELATLIGIEPSGFYASPYIGVPKGQTRTMKLGLCYNGKRYVFTVTVCNAEDFTAISGVQAATASRKAYDLSGRQVNAARTQKGIYIVDGQKVAVK